MTLFSFTIAIVLFAHLVDPLPLNFRFESVLTRSTTRAYRETGRNSVEKFVTQVRGRRNRATVASVLMKSVSGGYADVTIKVGWAIRRRCNQGGLG